MLVLVPSQSLAGDSFAESLLKLRAEHQQSQTVQPFVVRQLADSEIVSSADQKPGPGVKENLPADIVVHSPSSTVINNPAVKVMKTAADDDVLAAMLAGIQAYRVLQRHREC